MEENVRHTGTIADALSRRKRARARKLQRLGRKFKKTALILRLACVVWVCIAIVFFAKAEIAVSSKEYRSAATSYQLNYKLYELSVDNYNSVVSIMNTGRSLGLSSTTEDRQTLNDMQGELKKQEFELDSLSRTLKPYLELRKQNMNRAIVFAVMTAVCLLASIPFSVIGRKKLAAADRIMKKAVPESPESIPAETILEEAAPEEAAPQEAIPTEIISEASVPAEPAAGEIVPVGPIPPRRTAQGEGKARKDCKIPDCRAVRRCADDCNFPRLPASAFPEGLFGRLPGQAQHLHADTDA